MNHSRKFELVKRYYNIIFNAERLWNLEKVHSAVVKGWITAAEFAEITGTPFQPL